MTKYKDDIELPEFYDSKVEEKEILRFWNKEKIFKKVREARCNEEVLSLYSGPVFPTGYPHSGYILKSIIKDVFTRYGHKKNLKVDSRFGWDCHGIPVEYEVDKKLGIHSPVDIERIGIAKYNEVCRNFVDKHSGEWRSVSERTGNWVDFESEYHTMSMEHMERVWWVFKELHEKGLIYNATKVMPYSTGCFTNLSNFEAEQSCKEVTETGYTIVVSIIDSREKLLVWTTKPSSLALNFAMCVNPKLVYVKVKVCNKRGEGVVYILSKNSLHFIFPQSSDYTVVDELLGEGLQGLKYEPLFEGRNSTRKREILMEEIVGDDIGSGIVPLDDMIVEFLKQRGLIFKVEDVKYKKPYCWLSNTPLFYKQMNSWHIRVKSLVEDLLKNCSEVNWCPSDSEVDFRNWLIDKCQDWTIGRTRYWGTPVPIWSSPSGDEVVCVGSIEELKKLTGERNITNLHREFVDHLVIPSQTPGNPPLRRVSEVLDCWFESAAVPFAPNDQPSTTTTADFVVEGNDQQRGWFYTMLVLSTALSQPSPFRNVFSTGLVLDTDGSKVSKRKHNSNDPTRLIDKYGADAFRLYLLSSPLVEGKDANIQEAGVAHITQTVIQPLWRIFKHCTGKMHNKSWVDYGYAAHWYCSLNTMNAWILSCTESLLKFYRAEMDAYRLQNIVPRVITLLQQFEDWYIRYEKPDPNGQSTIVLFSSIYRLCLMLAPFAPFITECIYRKHREYVRWFRRLQSIHEALMEEPLHEYIDLDIERRVSRMQIVVELVRALRTRHLILDQYKISELTVIHHNEIYRNDIRLVEDLILEIANVRELRVSDAHHEFGGTLKVRLKNESSLQQNERLSAAVRELKDEEVSTLIREEKISLFDQTVLLIDCQISFQVEGKRESNCTVITDQDLLIAIKMNKDMLYYEGGATKEVANRIKILRRKANYYPGDKAIVSYSTKDPCLSHLMSKHREQFSILSKSELRERTCDAKSLAEKNCVEEFVDIKGNLMKLHLPMKSICD